ncbi:MAG: histidine--tRNA ligase [Candidatus Aenigmatarchaeota archaeon]
MDFKSMKGFRDFLPEENGAKVEVFERIEGVVERFGFREIDTPSLEPMDLFLVKSGEELVKQTYSFEDKGGRDVTLIPEQTPSRARIIASEKSLNEPIKWYSTSKRWRYEQTQKGRLREFYQTDVDIFGADSVGADAEIIAVLVEIMDKLDVLDAVDVLVNDRRLVEEVLENRGIEDTRETMEVIDDKEKMSKEGFVDELVETGLGREEAEKVEELTSISGPLVDKLEEVEELVSYDVRALQRMKELAEVLESYEVLDKVRLDLSIVRGLDYYTGLVFEVFDREGELRAICGGGRYDELVGLFGGEEVPAVGFAIGDAVIEELMRREGVWPEEKLTTDVYVLPVSGDVKDKALELVSKLRERGLVVETDLKDRNVSAQLDYANSIGAEKVVIVGERDLKEGKVTLKEMSSGDEKLINVEDIVEEVV